MDLNPYAVVKLLHMVTAIISICGFSLRGLIKLTRPQSLQPRWLRIAPHINDTLLLACAIYLAIQSQQLPGSSDWLTAKVVALLLYIGLGMVVMRFASSQRQRLIAFIAALLCFVYIVAVAVSRSPLPFS